MAVLWFEEKHTEEFTVTRDSQEHTRFFTAKTSKESDGRNQLLLFRPDLIPLSQWDDYPLLFVDKFNASRRPLRMWDITVDYATIAALEEEDNPLAIPPAISIDSVERKRIRHRDYKGRPVCNAAGDLFVDPPPEVEESDLIIRVKKNVPTRLPTWVVEYRNAVNSDVVRVKGLTFKAGYLKLKNLQVGEDEKKGRTAFCALSFELHYNEDGWTTIIPNRGYYERIAKNFKANRITGVSVATEWARKKILIRGEPPKEPVFLDRDGKVITDPNEQNIVFLEFDFNQKLPFNALPLK